MITEIWLGLNKDISVLYMFCEISGYKFLPGQNLFLNRTITITYTLLKGSPENSRQINCKFWVEFLGDSIANLYQSIDNISNFAIAYNEMF